MKKTFITILLFTLILTACGASNSTATDSNGNFGTAAPLPLAMELVVGTFKLEGTDNAVTADQAAKLLPLWQVYKDLSASSSAAQEEVDALAEQIQETMTPQQVQAITDMKLTRREIFQTMQDLGIASAGRPNASGTPRPSGQGGNFQGGGPGKLGARRRTRASTMDKICRLNRSQLFKRADRKTAEAADSSTASHPRYMMLLSSFCKAKNKTNH